MRAVDGPPNAGWRIFAAVAVFAGLIAAFAAGTGAGSAVSPVPPDRDILYANVEEFGTHYDGPSEEERLKPENRDVLFTMKVGERPECTPDTQARSYGFLIDSDMSKDTGSSFNDIGADVRITMSCDPVQQKWFSNIEDVASDVTWDTAPLSGEARLMLQVPVRDLPSIEFRWIAYSFDNGIMTRLPSSGRHGTFAIHERVGY